MAAQNQAASSLVCFTIGERSYALALAHVRELIRMVAITPLFNAPTEIVGAINLRGNVIPVLSLRARLDLPRSEPTLTDRIIIVQVGPQIVGFLVDSVEEIVTTAQVEMHSVAVDPTGRRTVVVARLHDRSIPILDPEILYAPGGLASAPVSQIEGVS